MKLFFLFLPFFFSIQCLGQENFDPYREVFSSYISDYIIRNNFPANMAIYVVKKEVITNNLNDKIVVGNQQYNIELISMEEIKKKNIDYIFEVMPIKNYKGYLSIDIILSGIKIKKKKIFFTNSGGGRYLLKFDCDTKKYVIEKD